MDGKRVAVMEKSGSGAGKVLGIVFGTILGLGLALSLGLSVYAGQFRGVFPGVTVAGTDLSRLTAEGAEQRLSETLPLWLDKDAVSIVADGEELLTAHPSELGVRVEPYAEARRAMDVGREPGALGWFKNGFTMGRCLLGLAPELEPQPQWSEDDLGKAAKALAEKFDRKPLNGSWDVSREGLFATKEQDGRALDQAALREMLTGTISGVIEAPFTSVKALPLDLEALQKTLPHDFSPAWYDRETGRVMDGQVGVELHVHAAAQVLEEAAPGERVKLPADIAYPEMTAQELEAVLFRDQLGTATTKVSGSRTRRNNVKLSGAAIDGYVLNPGDVFDYNKVVGKRTTEKGYGTAAAYVNGKTVESIGGGICQTSSTVYLASLLSNLEIVERYPHRFWPGYIPLGMDATVSWGGPEFKFRNNTAYPIRIDVGYEKDRLTVTMMGTKTDDTYVKMTHTVLSSSGYETEYVDDPELPYGTEKQIQNGYKGYEVKSFRNIYSGDGKLLSSKLEDKSSYKNRDQIIAVGTKGKPADTAQNPILPETPFFPELPGENEGAEPVLPPPLLP